MVFSGVRAVIARQIRRIGARSRTTATAPTGGPGPAIPTSAPTPQGETVFPYPSVVDLAPSIMVYSYAAPFETGKLKVSDVHSLQSVSGFGFVFFSPVVLGVCLTRTRTATRFQEIKMGLQVRSVCCFVQRPLVCRRRLIRLRLRTITIIRLCFFVDQLSSFMVREGDVLRSSFRP